MRRLHVLIAAVVIVVAAFLLYSVKYDVQALQADIAKTTRELGQEKEALAVAQAEWAYLNRPDRLRRLADKYLDTQAVTVDQVAEVEAIAFPQQMQAQGDGDDNVRPVAFAPARDLGDGE